MKPKPFWPLNHLTVPVVIFFSKAHERRPRDNHAANFNFVDVFGKGARGRIQQGTAANRMSSIYTTVRILQGGGPIRFGRPVLVIRTERLKRAHGIRSETYRLTRLHPSGHSQMTSD